MILTPANFHDRKTDARPLKTRNTEDILKAFKDIYKGPILSLPKLIEVDDGNEFKGIVKKYFNDHGVAVKSSLRDRHRQQAIVENKNLVIGRAIHKRQTAQELLTGEPSTEWVDDLPKIIKAINRRAKPFVNKNKSSDPVCQGESCNLLNIGDKVRIALDAPISATEKGEKLHGKFRASDIRFDPTIRKIENIYLNPGMPPLYLVSGISKATYTRNQIQLVNPNEKYPDAKKFIRGKPKVFKVEEIIKRKKIGNKIYYLVKWIGYEKPTLETRSILIQDIPETIKEYEKSIKK